MSRILDEINQPNDIKKIEMKDLPRLAKELRRFLLSNISKTGGHLASNLGVVELTMALHLFLQFPEDKLIWDVGHQAYVHKILTGRKKDFVTLRQYEGMSGFPKRKESDCDAFDTGHSSTSISVAAGLTKARDLAGKNHKIIAVIGDGALSGGMAFEALNNIGRLKTNLIVVLNDNNMSISENVGGMASYLGKVRTNTAYTDFKGGLENALKKVPRVGTAIYERLKRSKDSIKHLMIPGMLFEDMGLTYIGPIDGNNIPQMVTALQSASRVRGAALIHVVTKKGKGYGLAEQEPWRFHGVEPFDIRTGKTLGTPKPKSYTDVFSDEMLSLGKENHSIVAITAAMPQGTGLAAFGEAFPERFFDVGIAEEHAVTFAAGLAAGGYHPIVAIYSTFLQRAYDQIVHDVCVGKHPVVFAVDRAGIVGNDGETHQGIFDLSYLSHIPGMTVMAPKNEWEFRNMLRFAVDYKAPVALRYPRGAVYQGLESYQKPIVLGESELILKGNTVAFLAIGSMVEVAKEVADRFLSEGISVTLVNMRFVTPLDIRILDDLLKNHSYFVTMEENIASGGFGERVCTYLMEKKMHKVMQLSISLPNDYIEHGEQSILRKKYGLDADGIQTKIKEYMMTDTCEKES